MFELKFLTSLITFAFMMNGSPGPNNMMVTASGANFGYRRSLPHLLGVCIGFVSMILVVAAGLGFVFTKYPIVHIVLRFVGSAYLLYLAWKIATSSTLVKIDQKDNRPMTFKAAVLFQYVNPKGWMTAVTGVSSFSKAGSEYWPSAGLIALVFLIVCFLSVSIWASFGSLIGTWLNSAKSLKVFNIVMGVLTASCLFMIW
ncbi:lysine transporter LysE [Halobacteriovorax marinus]|uniref:Lysine transporter LysE n=1 Tax=Halobacteriovorax marinus TaxID=97084 RepID=A0A1Y5FAM1_9BACT|nr:lysine transporter LysE [Halobacteriovorax marinus]